MCVPCSPQLGPGFTLILIYFMNLPSPSTPTPLPPPPSLTGTLLSLRLCLAHSSPKCIFLPEVIFSGVPFPQVNLSSRCIFPLDVLFLRCAFSCKCALLPGVLSRGQMASSPFQDSAQPSLYYEDSFTILFNIQPPKLFSLFFVFSTLFLSSRISYNSHVYFVSCPAQITSHNGLVCF